MTINNVGLAEGFGSVVETLPAGFSYVEDSAASTDANAVIEAEVDGQTVTFTVVAVDSFTYDVTVGSNVADGEHTFSGVLKKLSGDDTIADSTVTVEAGTMPEPSPEPSPDPSLEPTPGDLSRSLPAAPVAPDDEFPVTINNVGLADGFGSVVETLPAGFSYVEDSAASTDANAVIEAEVDGQTVTFTVVGVDSFTYRVTVGPDVVDGPYTFSGSLKKLSGDEMIADSTVTVGGPAPAVGDLSRSLPAGQVARDGEFPVTINNIGLADGFGSVVETLPAGFSYVEDSAVSTTPSAVIDVEVDGQTVTFTLVAVDSFTYRVTVGSDVADGSHTFSGVLNKLSGTDMVGGASSITVGDPPRRRPLRTPTPTPTPTPMPTPTMVPPTPTPTMVPPPPTPTMVPPPPTPTMVPPPPTPTMVPPPPTPTMVPPPPTMVPPTATPPPTPRPTATATAVPTATPVPTATAAPTAAPTATSQPTAMPEPTPTAMMEQPTPAPTPTVPPAPPEEEGGGFPVWAIVLIVIGAAVALIGGGGYIVIRARQQ